MHCITTPCQFTPFGLQKWKNWKKLETTSFTQKINLSSITDEDVLTSSTFKTPNEFSRYIEQVSFEQDISLLEALLNYADTEDLEPEAIAKLINKSLKEKLQYESEEAALIVKTSNRLEF